MSGIDLSEYHAAVPNFIAAGCEWLKAVHCYPELKAPLNVPCAFFAVNNWAVSPENQADGQLKIDLDCVVLVAVNKAEKDYAQYVRQAAMALTVFIHNSRLGVASEPAQVQGAAPYDFIKELDAYEVWAIDFTHSIYVGQSLYLDDGGTVPSRIFTSFVPLIGAINEPFYTELTE